MIREIIEKYIDLPHAKKEWEYAILSYIPLTPSIMKEFEKKINTAYHVTGDDGLKSLKKIINQKKQISAFTKGSEGISTGAMSGSDFLVELSGVSSFIANSDIRSSVSRNGYRWIYFGSAGLTGFTDIMGKKIGEYLNTGPQNYMGELNHMSGKEKQSFIKWYFDEAKKLMNKKLIKTIQKKIDIENIVIDDWDNNELFLHSIKVKNVKYIENISSYAKLQKSLDFMDYDGAEEIVTDLGFKYGGVIIRNDIPGLGR